MEGKSEAAIYAYNTALKLIDPNNHDQSYQVYFNLGLAHRKRGNLELSIEALRKALDH